MGDILPPKKQAIVERLKRRFDGYRHHQGSCLPRYELASNGLYEQHKQGTLLLQQRYLEPKAKKVSKKNEQKNKDLQSTLTQQKLLKRPAESPGGDPSYDNNEHPSKIARTCSNANQNLTQFSVEIVQQFTSTGSSQPQQIQTNVTVKTLAGGNAKTSDSSMVSTSTGTVGSNNNNGKPQDSRPSTTLECKQEPELELDGCLLGSSDNLNNGAQSITDSLSNFPFMEDSTDEIIHPDTLKDLIAELTPDIISDFNFDKFDDSAVDSVKNDDNDKDLVSPNSILDMGKTLNNATNSQLPGSATSTQFSSASNTSASPLFDSGGNNSLNSLSSMSPANASVVPPSNRMSSYPLGLEFSLKEPSPAAQTLKQMAEQHQNMQQKQQQLGLGMGSPHSRSPFGPDFGLPSSGQFSTSNSNEFLNSSSTANSSGAFLSKNAPGNMFPFSQNNNSNLMKQDTSTLYGTNQTAATLNPLTELELRKRQQMLQMQRLGVDQKPSGQPTSPGPTSNTAQLGFGTTKPLSHFTEPVTSSGQGNALPPQFMRNSGQQFSHPPRPMSGPNIQMSQSQQLQISQNNQQLQVSQGQHIQIQDLGSVSQAQQQSIYGFQPQPNDQYQLSVSQSQSVNFSGSSQQSFPNRGNQPRMDIPTPPGGMQSPPYEKLDSMMRQKMLQQQMMHRHQLMEKQKMAQLQRQQQAQPPAQSSATQQAPSGMSFISRPPPEYKPQTSRQQMSSPNLSTMTTSAMMNQTFNPRAATPLGGGQTTPSGSIPPLGLPQPGNQGLQHRLMGPGTPSSAAMSYSGGSANQMNLNSLASNQGMATTRMTTAVSKANSYTSPLLRGQRPPNVNVGPDGLNISHRGPSTQDWRQMLLHNQVKFGGANVRPSYSQTNTMGFSSMQGGVSNNLQMSAMPIRLNSGGLPPMSRPQVLGNNGQLLPQSMGMSRAAPSGLTNNMNMSSSVPLPSNQNQNNFLPSSGNGPTDFNLDFLDNMEGGADSGFSSSDATDLLNSFDSVMQNTNTNYMLDGGL